MSENPRRRRTVARHGQLATPGPVNQLLKLIAIGLAVVLVSGFGVAAYIAYDFSSTVAANAVDLEGQEAVPPDIGEYEEGFNLVLTGVDTCEEKYAGLFGERCTGSDAGGTLNDVNLLVHVSQEPRRITVVSFPRDLMIPIPECVDDEGNVRSAMSKQPLNTAYTDGGLNCVVKTISELTDQEIQFAASVTFGGVIEITNAIGGVDVCLANPIKDRYTGLDMAAGTHTVEGLQALQFLRTRHGVGDGSDLGRIGNQQQYMSSLARKMISGEVLGNVPVMLKLANTALSNLEASTSLANNPMTLVQIALAVKSVPFEDIVFVQYPTGADYADPNKVVPNQEAAAALWDAIEANAQLQITHQNTSNDGVIVQEPTEPVTEATPDPTATPDTVVALPDSIKGNSAAQTTCSNGNVR
ncbi:LCP family protein [Microbacterium sp. KSW4-16]|uniref:LCP family protein n=2 Tax=Microbacterium aurugineum TaxID=2851642 RepID=A0ABY4J1I2_9MICO|nr:MULTISPECIES: LCP family protein [Microbacterium]MCK8467115.1 LCP family protein [Microbacterium aurugineum]QEA28465.1 LytR family transcriptional regulator [Microbacterium sp. CBA3102]TCJ22759.1 LytR family transcriptional regulator [Microbacterium sp. PI-1]UPL18787.1 LCP family protein [Microbacterium aurugineum]